MTTTTYRLTWLDDIGACGRCTQCGKRLGGGYVVWDTPRIGGERYCGADCAIEHARIEDGS